VTSRCSRGDKVCKESRRHKEIGSPFERCGIGSERLFASAFHPKLVPHHRHDRCTIGNASNRAIQIVKNPPQGRKFRSPDDGRSLGALGRVCVE
jgi:hypothetical protein